MPDALELALANAASNMPKGEELHLENLDSIADPIQDEPSPDYPPYVVTPKPPEYDPRAVAFSSSYRQQVQVEEDYYPKSNPSKLALDSIDYKLGEITNAVMYLHTKVDNISTIINTAASMSSEPNHKHRSLHEWDDSTLLNELVERENDLMPFYYELLKRIGSPELQKLVMSSMQGKNNSMVTLAQLCSALGSMVQPQSQPPQVYEVGLSPSAEQRMNEAFHAVTTPQTYTQAQLDNLRFNGQSSGITVEEIAQYERMKRNTQPDYPVTIPSMPPTYNPFFKEQ
jgi:hypothetical protein